MHTSIQLAIPLDYSYVNLQSSMLKNLRRIPRLFVAVVGSSLYYLLWVAQDHYPQLLANAFAVHRSQIRSPSSAPAPLHLFSDKVEVVSPSSSRKAKKRASSVVAPPSSSKSVWQEKDGASSGGLKFWANDARTSSSSSNSNSKAVVSTTNVIDCENSNSSNNTKQATALVVAAVAVLVGGASAWEHFGDRLPDIVAVVTSAVAHPQATLQSLVEHIQAMGPAGLVYFGILYTLAEVLAVPATPLTLSAGYLFGMTQGVLVVLISATIAASIAFVVGKTVLRSWVEEMLEANPKFAKLDQAVGEQGFQLLVLLRLSPLFPFALSNYLYGASAISFPAYFWATLLGFAPGTLALVYTGMVGQELLLGNNNNATPWYIYATGFVGVGILMKLVSDVAGGIVAAIDDDDLDG